MPSIPDKCDYYGFMPWSFEGHARLTIIDSFNLPLSLALSRGQPVKQSAPILLSASTSGAPMDVYFSMLGIPVMSSKAAEVVRGIAGDDVQLLPAALRPDPDEAPLAAGGPYFVCNVITVVESSVSSNALLYALDPSSAQSHHVMRPSVRLPDVIVSDELRRAIEASNLVVAGFTPRSIANRQD